jgi:hypothetical protein
MQHTGELPIVTVDYCAVCLDFRHLCRETRQSIFGAYIVESTDPSVPRGQCHRSWTIA